MLRQWKMSRSAEKMAITVRVLRKVVNERAKLDLSFAAESKSLDSHAKNYYQATCAGVLRHLNMYDELFAKQEVKLPRDDDDTLRLLGASIIFQAENMDQAPSVNALCLAASEYCEALKRQAEDAIRLEDAVYNVLRLQNHERDEALSPAGKLSLPEWLHAKLESGSAPLSDFGRLLRTPPSFLSLAVAPKEFAPSGFESRDAYVETLTGIGLDAAASSFAPHGVVVHGRNRDPGGRLSPPLALLLPSSCPRSAPPLAPSQHLLCLHPLSLSFPDFS